MKSTDMRLGMYRLQGIVDEYEGGEVQSGTIFLFTNKGHSLLKAVWFDGSGLVMYVKRLEKGTFSWPLSAADDASLWLHLSPSALQLLIDGIEFKKCHKKAWYEA